ncbi:hypothetical protein [Sphingobium baderi]|uniref:hypothetical protein n=1 Tax=Sphingobium baderi TaxID=1332080 RepID=UPI002B409B94|nr:hypothetical protein [Sphingobium baderi]WRD76756.1 hypothetical protein QQ987_00980 [Sphingobium baderi]
MEGEALGALPIGDPGAARAPLAWPGSWLAGTRPGQTQRMDGRAGAARPEAAGGNRIR